MAADEKLKSRIDDLIRDQLCLGENQEIKPENSLVDDLGADDLDEIEVVMALEEEFGITIDEDDAQGLKTVQNIYDYIDKRMNG